MAQGNESNIFERIASQANHHNIVAYFGIVYLDAEVVGPSQWMVIEYHDQGCLEDLIHGANRAELTQSVGHKIVRPKTGFTD